MRNFSYSSRIWEATGDFWVTKWGKQTSHEESNYMTAERDEDWNQRKKDLGTTQWQTRVPSINCFTPSPPTTSNLSLEPDLLDFTFFSLLISKPVIFHPWSPSFPLSIFHSFRAAPMHLNPRSSDERIGLCVDFERNPELFRLRCWTEEKKSRSSCFEIRSGSKQIGFNTVSWKSFSMCFFFTGEFLAIRFSSDISGCCVFVWERKRCWAHTPRLIIGTQSCLWCAHRKEEEKMGGQKRETLFQPFLISFRHIVSVLEQTFNLLSRKEKASSTPHALLIIFRGWRKKKRAGTTRTAAAGFGRRSDRVCEVSGTLLCTHWLLPLFSRALHNLCQSSVSHVLAEKNFLENFSKKSWSSFTQTLMRTYCLAHD